MTTKEIETLIKGGLPLPETATLNEKFYYNAIDVIFAMYKLGRLDKKGFKDRQKEYINLFNQVDLWQKIYRQHLEIQKALVQVEFKDCEICKRVQQILDGREEGAPSEQKNTG